MFKLFFHTSKNFEFSQILFCSQAKISKGHVSCKTVEETQRKRNCSVHGSADLWVSWFCSCSSGPTGQCRVTHLDRAQEVGLRYSKGTLSLATQIFYNGLQTAYHSPGVTFFIFTLDNKLILCSWGRYCICLPRLFVIYTFSKYQK